MSELEKNESVSKVSNLARFFELDLTIRLFGVTILHLVIPPKEN